MKFCLTKEHRRHFDEKGYIEFEGIIDEKTLAKIRQGIGAALEERKNLKSPVAIYTRDLWSSTATLGAWIKKSSLAEIASELFYQNTLRFGFDQFITSETNFISEKGPTSLQELCSLQTLTGAFLVCLEEPKQPLSDLEPMSLPKKAGNGTFFAIDKPLLTSDMLATASDGKYLLIGFSTAITVYIANPRDPGNLSLRELGYNFGDKLQDKTHPILFRRSI
jgi:hypothetical protein